MNRVIPLRPAGGAATGFAHAPDSYGQHRAISFVCVSYRSYRYALGALPRISPGGARNATPVSLPRAARLRCRDRRLSVPSEA